MRITVVIGPPCAGKSTWVELNAPTGAARLDFDRLAMTLGSPDPHSAPPIIFEAALAARRGIIGWALNPDTEPEGDLYLIFSFIGDETIKKFDEAGAEFVLIDPGEDACLERAEADGRPERTLDAITRWYANPPDVPGAVAADPKGMDMTKVLRASIGAIEKKDAGDSGGAGTAEFDAYASVFDNVDSYGDVMVKGAFSRSLKEWAARDAPIPALWGHNMSDPDYNIGHVVDAKEDDHGLRVRVQIDLDSPKGATVYRLLQQKRVREMSFAFWVKEWHEGKQDDTYVRYVDDVDLIEVSVVPMGANPEAEVLAVKAAGGTPPGTPVNVDRGGKSFSAKDVADILARLDALEARATGDNNDPDPDDDGGPGGGGDTDDNPPGDDDPGAKSAAAWPELNDLLETLYTRPGASNS